ncbi:MAG TPA: hypothetical protein VI462_14890 [Acidimicrobiia bacterium]
MGDWIDLDAFLPTIKDAARHPRRLAGVGWALALVATALGAIPPEHWPLLVIGVVGILVLAVQLVRAIVERRDNRRLAARPPTARVPRPVDRPTVHLRVDVPKTPTRTPEEPADVAGGRYPARHGGRAPDTGARRRARTP